MTHLDDFLRGRIIACLESGRTQLKVSEEFGITQSAISRLWQRFQDDGNGMGSTHGEGTGVYKCIVPSRHGGNLNSHRAASREVGGKGRKAQTLCLWMTTPVFTMQTHQRMPSIRVYPLFGLASILTGLESRRACAGHAWPMNCSE
ncbi:hypothetical protein TNCV_229731 [Trichonephila clavipes]|nr:hypothetical protein TNCV_229731 [Trichonephila clavipes]